MYNCTNNTLKYVNWGVIQTRLFKQYNIEICILTNLDSITYSCGTL